MTKFLEWLENQPVVILDGAMSTGLEEQGISLSHRLWTAKAIIEAPNKIQKVHEAYFNAGANIAITASYQASIQGFKEFGYTENEAVERIKETVFLAKEAAKISKKIQEKWIAGSVGPYGAYLADGSEYRGKYGVSDLQLKEFHQKRIEALIEAGADILAIETMPDFQEIKVILSIVEQYPEIPVWVSVTVKNDTQLNDGTSLLRFQQAMEKNEQVLAYGVNCLAPHLVLPILEVLKKKATKPRIVYPNSGAVYDAKTKTWNHSEESATIFSEEAKKWYQLGATWVGGCCCTTAAEIKTLAKVLCE